MNALYKVHVLLISMASVFCAFFGFMAIRSPEVGGPMLGGFSLVASGTLAAYLAWFIRSKREQPRP